MRRRFKIGEQEKVLFITLISLIFIVAVVIASGKDNYLKGAVTTDVSMPVFHLNMDSASLSKNTVLKSGGVSETDSYRGKIQNAWIFERNDNFVITSSNHLQELDKFTIMFWIDPGDLSLRKRAHIVWQGEVDEKSATVNTGNGWGPEQELHISFGDEIRLDKYEDHKLIFYFGDHKNKLKLAVPLKIIGWHHVAVTVKNTKWGAVAELFLDGSSVSKGKIEQKIDRSQWSGTLRLGAAGTYGPATDSNRHYGGLIDELTIYNRVLTAKEIASTCRTQNNGDFC